MPPPLSLVGLQTSRQRLSSVPSKNLLGVPPGTIAPLGVSKNPLGSNEAESEGVTTEAKTAAVPGGTCVLLYGFSNAPDGAELAVVPSGTCINPDRLVTAHDGAELVVVPGGISISWFTRLGEYILVTAVPQFPIISP